MPPISPPKPSVIIAAVVLLAGGFTAASGLAGPRKPRKPPRSVPAGQTSTSGTTTTSATTASPPTTTAPTTTTAPPATTTAPTTTTTAPTGQILWRGDYETGNFTQWAWHQWSQLNDQGTTVAQVGNSSATIVPAPARQGQYAAKFVVLAQPLGTSVPLWGGWRSEVADDGSNTGAVDGQTSYYGWSTYIPSGQTFDSSYCGFNVITTGGHGPDSAPYAGNPVPLSIGIDACDSANVHLYAEYQDLSGTDHDQFGHSSTRTDIGRLVSDQWNDFVARITWSKGTNGRVQLWRNGVLVFDTVNAGGIMTENPGHPDGSQYWKQGFYRGSPNYTNTVYQDGMCRAATYADAAAC